MPSRRERKVMTHKEQTGFTLMETMVSLAVLLAVSAIVMGGMNQMMRTQGTVANRTEMHTSVRDATEVLEQEIGQAGKISLPTAPVGGWLMLTPVVVPKDVPVTATVSFSPTLLNVNGAVLFDGELLLVDTGANQETVTITCPVPGTCTTTWTAGPFLNSHGLNVPITAPGAFSTGVVPPAAGVTPGYAGYANCAPAPTPCGSTGNVLKLYGDVNGDGNMLYVEYTCVPGTAAAPGFLYRNQMAFNAPAGSKPAVNPSMVVLSNVLTNPPDANGVVAPCFTYQVITVGLLAEFSFVTDVAVTLTVQTALQDPQTHQFQNETKALLNVSPRNVFNAYLLARQDYTNRVQPMPWMTKNNLLFP
jgi:prepilin-type N-terminal cleavage/methylation domain-containing protein